jgi:hypothetical protein
MPGLTGRMLLEVCSLRAEVNRQLGEIAPLATAS